VLIPRHILDVAHKAIIDKEARAVIADWFEDNGANDEAHDLRVGSIEPLALLAMHAKDFPLYQTVEHHIDKKRGQHNLYGHEYDKGVCGVCQRFYNADLLDDELNKQASRFEWLVKQASVNKFPPHIMQLAHKAFIDYDDKARQVLGDYMMEHGLENEALKILGPNKGPFRDDVITFRWLGAKNDDLKLFAAANHQLLWSPARRGHDVDNPEKCEPCATMMGHYK
jgi:hypothetical protein